MSERTHSELPSAAPRRRKWFPLIAGTGAALVLAGVGLQIFRAEPAASQTRDAAAPAAGTARTQSPAGSPKGEVLARVNNQNIGWELVATECMERHGAEVLDNIINRVLIHQACQARGITITEAEVQQEVHSIARKFNLPTATWYQMLESERGIKPAQYHRDVIWPMLALKRLAGSDVQISEQELQRAFISHYGPRVEARMIAIDGNLRHATQVWEQATAKPDDFARLASEYSADPNSRALGGQIPPIRRFASPDNSPQAKVEEQAFKLKPGEISPVLQIGENQFVILRCEKLTDPIVTDIEQVRADLTEQLKDEKTQEAVASVFADIKSKAQIHNYLTNESTGGASGGVVQQTGATQPAGPARNPSAARGTARP